MSAVEHASVAADYRHAPALEQRSVAVRAIGHPLVAVLPLARDTELAPACPRGKHDRARFQRRSVLQLDADEIGARNEPFRALLALARRQDEEQGHQDHGSHQGTGGEQELGQRDAALDEARQEAHVIASTSRRSSPK